MARWSATMMSEAIRPNLHSVTVHYNVWLLAQEKGSCSLRDETLCYQGDEWLSDYNGSNNKSSDTKLKLIWVLSMGAEDMSNTFKTGFRTSLYCFRSAEAMSNYLRMKSFPRVREERGRPLVEGLSPLTTLHDRISWDRVTEFIWNERCYLTPSAADTVWHLTYWYMLFVLNETLPSTLKCRQLTTHRYQQRLWWHLFNLITKISIFF